MRSNAVVGRRGQPARARLHRRRGLAGIALPRRATSAIPIRGPAGAIPQRRTLRRRPRLGHSRRRPAAASATPVSAASAAHGAGHGGGHEARRLARARRGSPRNSPRSAFARASTTARPIGTRARAYVFRLDEIEQDIEKPPRSCTRSVCIWSMRSCAASGTGAAQDSRARLGADRRKLAAARSLALRPLRLRLRRAPSAQTVGVQRRHADRALRGRRRAMALAGADDRRRAAARDADQFTSAHEKLIARFAEIGGGEFLHLACMAADGDDAGTLAYLQDCAQQAGLQTESLDMGQIGLTAGRFVDPEGRRSRDCSSSIPGSGCSPTISAARRRWRRRGSSSRRGS